MNRYDRQERIEDWNQKKLREAEISLVGAGALGTVVAVAAVELGIGKIKIYDGDRVEETNLNRQFLFRRSSIGEPKARELARELKRINPDSSVSPYVVNIDGRNVSSLGNTDVIVDCTDNYVVRKVLNSYAIRRRIPLVSGASSPYEGQVVVYAPGKTPCLDCKLDIERLARRDATRANCPREPNPSIVTTNLVVGAEMSQQVRKLIHPFDEDDEVLTGILKYDSLANTYTTISVRKRAGCRCV